MSADRPSWRRVKELLRQSQELDPGQRSAFLSEVCGDDAQLRREVESLLAHDDEAQQAGFLASGAKASDTDPESADANLLLGILAMQLDFISRQELIAATSVWMKDKTKTLQQILVARQSLPNEERDLLAALVEKHLAKNDNNPQQSLAKLSSIGSIRDELEQLGDHDIEKTLAYVGVNARSGVSDTDDEASIEFSLGSRTSTGSRFRIVRPHAKGGLGEIFVARDEELDREVAVKEIQSTVADDANVRSRFLQEAEITGKLQHPGIVPVYGLGTYNDGRPFYAMQFIKGKSLKEAIEEFHEKKYEDWEAGRGNQELRALLGRFIDVCNAIEYAHSRAVLHRDLKPGNIMLGKYGETLVVDWGLAKLVDRDEPGQPPVEPAVQESLLELASGTGSASTRYGSALGTPAYMSPEQAGGRWDELGAASDVYSLGATLYCLLTGQPPQQDGMQALENIQHGKFPRPRELNKLIPVDLEAICLKAMAFSPADRYPSPGTLKQDLDAWMAGSSITVPETWQRCISRRVQNYRYFLLVGICMLTSLVVAMDAGRQFDGLPRIVHWVFRITMCLILVLAFSLEHFARLRREQEFSLKHWSHVRQQGRRWYVWRRSISTLTWAIPLTLILVFFALTRILDEESRHANVLLIAGVCVLLSSLVVGYVQNTWTRKEAHFIGKGQAAAREKEKSVRKTQGLLSLIALIGLVVAMAGYLSRGAVPFALAIAIVVVTLSMIAGLLRRY